MKNKLAGPCGQHSRVLPVVAAFIALLLSSCTTAPASGPEAAWKTPAGACTALAGLVIRADQIGLPSAAARIDSAVVVAVAPSASPALPAYCRVVGTIAPRDAGADPIRFQLNLPTRWNGKAVMIGGGGFNGSLVTGLAPLRDAAPGQAHPLAQGFATFGTDSGHDAAVYGATDPAKFAMNEEMFLNFAHQAYKKVKDVAQRTIVAHYGSAPSRQYFYGGSESCVATHGDVIRNPSSESRASVEPKKMSDSATKLKYIPALTAPLKLRSQCAISIGHGACISSHGSEAVRSLFASSPAGDADVDREATGVRDNDSRFSERNQKTCRKPMSYPDDLFGVN